jgi:hypothetical protein
MVLLTPAGVKATAMLVLLSILTVQSLYLASMAAKGFRMIHRNLVLNHINGVSVIENRSDIFKTALIRTIFNTVSLSSPCGIVNAASKEWMAPGNLLACGCNRNPNKYLLLHSISLKYSLGSPSFLSQLYPPANGALDPQGGRLSLGGHL